MPTFRIEDEHGQWLTNMRLGPREWKAGDRIPRGTDTLEVIDVRLAGEDDTTDGTLVVVATGHVPMSD
jgi:hypothetical protein